MNHLFVRECSQTQWWKEIGQVHHHEEPAIVIEKALLKWLPFPAMDIRVIPLKFFICLKVFFGIGMMMFSRPWFGVSFWFRTAFVISRIAECKKLPLYFTASAVIASSEPDNLLFFIDFIAFKSFAFVKFDIFIFRCCGVSGMFDVSIRSLELFKSSSEYFPHSSTISSQFAGGSLFLLFRSVALFMVDFPDMSLFMKNTLSGCFRVAASSASAQFCYR